VNRRHWRAALTAKVGHFRGSKLWQKSSQILSPWLKSRQSNSTHQRASIPPHRLGIFNRELDTGSPTGKLVFHVFALRYDWPQKASYTCNRDRRENCVDGDRQKRANKWNWKQDGRCSRADSQEECCRGGTKLQIWNRQNYGLDFPFTSNQIDIEQKICGRLQKIRERRNPFYDWLFSLTKRTSFACHFHQ
jgi:hypothetical protein